MEILTLQTLRNEPHTDRIEHMFEERDVPTVLPSHPRDVLALLIEHAHTSLDALDDEALLEHISAWERFTSWTQAHQMDLIAELDQRIRRSDTTPRIAVEMTVGEELSHALALSSRTGIDRAKVAIGLTRDLPDTLLALRRGLIDYPKAALIAHELRDRPIQIITTVEDEVLPWAPRCSRAQLKHRIDRALIQVNPHDANLRHLHARTTRRINRPKPLRDGMASIYMVLPADDATIIDTCLATAARASRSHGDPRTTDQLRADTLTMLASHALHVGGIGVCPHT